MHIIGHSAILVAPFGQISTASYIQSLFIIKMRSEKIIGTFLSVTMEFVVKIEI